MGICRTVCVQGSAGCMQKEVYRRSCIREGASEDVRRTGKGERRRMRARQRGSKTAEEGEKWEGRARRQEELPVKEKSQDKAKDGNLVLKRVVRAAANPKKYLRGG